MVKMIMRDHVSVSAGFNAIGSNALDGMREIELVQLYWIYGK
jgi:hypothetical protein